VPSQETGLRKLLKNLHRNNGKTEQEFFQSQFNDERLNKRLGELQENIGKAGFREERKRIRMSQNVTDVEDFSQEEWKTLVARNEELKSLQKSDPLQFDKIFSDFDIAIPGTDEKLSYAIHAGSPELMGGKLDPNLTKGTSNPASRGAGGNTKAANLHIMKLAEDDILRMEEGKIPGYEKRLEIGKRQLSVAEEGGGFMSARKPSLGMASGYFGRTNWERCCKC